jgi:hypothetical protein
VTERKIYSVAEANDLLPYLAPALVELRERWEQAAAAAAARARARITNGGPRRGEGDLEAMARVDELTQRIANWGLELRDVASGLVDFPAVVEGVDAFLCWRLGEPEVGHWHPTSGGFGGRRPLSG